MKIYLLLLSILGDPEPRKLVVFSPAQAAYRLKLCNDIHGACAGRVYVYKNMEDMEAGYPIDAFTVALK